MPAPNYREAHRCICELEAIKRENPGYTGWTDLYTKLSVFAGQFARSKSTSSTALRRRIDNLLRGAIIDFLSEDWMPSCTT